MEKRKEDCSMKEDRTLKDGLSSYSNLPANITEVTASTTASGALFPTSNFARSLESLLKIAQNYDAFANQVNL